MADVSAPQRIEVVIEPTRGWLKINWAELWEYRDLLVLLVQRDFTSRYKQTILGPLWFVLQPVLTAAIFAAIFNGVARIPTDNVPAVLFYLCSLLGWNYFAQNIGTAGATFVNNSALFGKVYFPRLLVPVSIVIGNLAAVALQAIPFVVVFVFEALTHTTQAAHLTWMAPLAVIPLLQMALLSLGVGLWMSAATAKYRDLVHLTQYIVQIWMFATPVFWPLSSVSTKWEWVIYANPMAIPVETLRVCLVGQGTLHTPHVLASVLWTLVILSTGIALFQKVERTVVDSV